METFDNLRYGDLIPGAYGQQGITINDLIQMCEGMAYIYYMENFRFISFAAYKTEYFDEKTDKFIKSSCDQKNGYNISFPKKNGELCVTGCAPVAVGQLMRYFEHPSTYKNFNWNAMDLTEATTITSNFLYDLALEMDTPLGVKKSSTNISNRENFMHKYFNFNTTSNSNAIDGSLVMIRADFDAGGHVWLSGGYRKSQRTVTNEIYTFITENEMATCGNMEQVYEYLGSKAVYMNWGWGGSYDGYYATPGWTLPLDNSSPSGLKVYTGFTRK